MKIDDVTLGDVVQLKSGSRAMTVVERDGLGQVRCAWGDDRTLELGDGSEVVMQFAGEIRRDWFPAEALESTVGVPDPHGHGGWSDLAHHDTSTSSVREQPDAPATSQNTAE